MITDEPIFPGQPAKDDRIRVIRTLPKRKGVERAPSNVSVAESVSSVDSISPSGGFLSPLEATTTRPPTISFPAFDPSANFPLQLFPSGCSTDGMFDSPSEMLGSSFWNMGESNLERIQSVLDNSLTLGPSPSLNSMYTLSPDSDGPSTSSMDDAIAQNMLNFDGLDNDEFLSLLTNIVNESQTTEVDDYLGNMFDVPDFLVDETNETNRETAGGIVLEAEVMSLGSGRSTPSLIEDKSFESVATEAIEVEMEVVEDVQSEVPAPTITFDMAQQAVQQDLSPLQEAVVVDNTFYFPPFDGYSPIPIDPALRSRDPSPLPTSARVPSAPSFYNASFPTQAPMSMPVESPFDYPVEQPQQYSSFPIYTPPAQPFYPNTSPDAHHYIAPQQMPPTQAGYQNGWIPDALPFDNAYGYPGVSNVPAGPAYAQPPRGKWVFVEE